VDQGIFLMAFASAIRAIVRPDVLAANTFTVPDVMEQIVKIFFAGIMTETGRTAFGEFQKRQLSQSQ
jgi:hypothetical protein